MLYCCGVAFVRVFSVWLRDKGEGFVNKRGTLCTVRTTGPSTNLRHVEKCYPPAPRAKQQQQQRQQIDHQSAHHQFATKQIQQYA